MSYGNRLDRLERAMGGGDGREPIAVCTDPATCDHASHFTFRVNFPDGEVEETLFNGWLSPDHPREGGW